MVTVLHGVTCGMVFVAIAIDAQTAAIGAVALAILVHSGWTVGK